MAPGLGELAEYRYPLRLNALRQGGDAEGVAVNPFVPERLLKPSRRQDHGAQYVSLGSVEEAASSAEMGREAWEAAPGALNWLKEATKPVIPLAPEDTPRRPRHRLNGSPKGPASPHAQELAPDSYSIRKRSMLGGRKLWWTTRKPTL
jgi:hypothetical protein